ncbi:unnamed protein product [Pseudo-nitzschia multistriata]|uniref:Uncharacterized protein n=1 Tax=Pseudo-nitzschia multistriata TaxID=183589 RepID=A0A448YWZ8_9STRA|nr:unnamed protein product [Pseudo-nitzschia multistriata]
MAAWTLGFVKWMTFPSSLKRLTSSIPGMLVAPSFLSVVPSLASDCAAALRDTFLFFLRTDPFPPVDVEAPPNRLAIILARAAAIASVSAIVIVVLLYVYMNK